MSYTNQTANYGLPQYTADDKPTYLGDFNKAMLDIDTAIKDNENIATASQTLAQNANNSASEALSTANTASSSATNAGVKADNAYALAESAKADATQATTDATDAKTIANSANQTATSANATATSAQTTATNANNTATAVQTTVNNLVKNATDQSTDKTYSCDYINKEFKNAEGTVLWTNANPENDFTGGKITLSQNKSNFDSYEIVYRESSKTYMTTGILPIGLNTRTIGAISGLLSWRDIYTNSPNTDISVADNEIYIANGNQQSANNVPSVCVPVYVIAYKNNLGIN